MNKNLVWHEGMISYKDRCKLLNQRGLVIWFTGLSGSGKSTISAALEKRLHDEGLLTYRLDGDNVRYYLNSDLGFTDVDRKENIRRITEVAALLKDAGLIVLVSCISPHRDMREFAKQRIGEENFIEVYVKASLETCKKRDPKQLYAKGINCSYDIPENPTYVLDTEIKSIATNIEFILNEILKK